MWAALENLPERLPYCSPQPEAPRRRPWARAARIAAYLGLLAALIGVVAQFQVLTQREMGAARRVVGPDAPDRELLAVAHKGALARWSKAVRQFWRGRNIYRTREAASAEGPEPAVWLHPNMPLVVLLLSPFAYLPATWMALSWNVLKVAVLAGAALAAVAAVNHKDRRMGDWVLGLALLWTLLLVIGDMQHGNTNVFVLGAIALHLWLYRRGRDVAAGAALALAICLKLTPALFLLYWLYQRQWRVLGASLAALLVLAVALPWAVLTVAFGPAHFVELAGTWLGNLVVPGLVKGTWYPVHINQSLSGVLSRYLLGGDAGNVFWNPDDNPAALQTDVGHIHLAAWAPATVRWLLRLTQAAIVALMAWAIGWRKLPRDDGRRGLHYALVLLGMMLLNQRTWGHHAAVLLPAAVALWYAVAYGRVSRRARVAALVLLLAAGPLLWLGGKDTFTLAAKIAGRADVEIGPHETATVAGCQMTVGPEGRELGDLWHDLAEAYGITFCYFVLLLAAAVVLCVSLRGRDRPYADRRQRLLERLEAGS